MALRRLPASSGLRAMLAIAMDACTIFSSALLFPSNTPGGLLSGAIRSLVCVASSDAKLCDTVASHHHRMLHLSFSHSCISLHLPAPLYHVHRHHTTLLPNMASLLTRRLAALATATSSIDASRISSFSPLTHSPNAGVHVC